MLFKLVLVYRKIGAEEKRGLVDLRLRACAASLWAECVLPLVANPHCCRFEAGKHEGVVGLSLFHDSCSRNQIAYTCRVTAKQHVPAGGSMDNQQASGDRTEFLSGILFLIIGISGTAIASKYPIGTAARMGPGYFPIAISLLLTAVGTALCLVNRRAFKLFGTSTGHKPHGRQTALWRALVVVMSSIGSFALLIERFGLAPASIACLVVAFYGGRTLMSESGRWWEGIVLALGLTAFSVLIFVYGIGIPMRVWPR